jgi:hypothetical protein
MGMGTDVRYPCLAYGKFYKTKGMGSQNKLFFLLSQLLQLCFIDLLQERELKYNKK